MAGNIHKSQFNTSIKFEIDQASLASLKSALQDVSMAASKARFQGELTQELNDAAKAAEHLSTILTQSWNTKLNQFDLTKLNNSIKESYGSITALKNQLNAGGTTGAVAFNKIAQAVLSTNIQLKQSNEWLNKMAITMSNTIRFGISSSIMNNFTNSIQKAYNYVQKLDKSLNDIRIVSGASADQMDRFARYANNAAQKLGASTLDYTNAALIYFQQGLDEAEVKLRSDVTVKMSNVLGDSAEEVSNYMTAIWNNFAKGSDNLEYYADVLAKLGAETASSAEEISQGLEKFSAVADAVGLSYEYAAAALTTVTDRTRQSADVVGTAFKTLFARIQDLELGDEGTVTIGKYSEALEKFDIHVLDSEGNLKRMDDILNEMGAKWQTMSDAQKVALAQNVAGVRQYTQLMSLMENWDFFTQNVDSARDATGALQKQQEIYLDSVAAKLEQLGAEAEKFYSNLLDEKAIKSFASLLTTALKTINTYLTGLGGGLTGVGTLLLNGAGLFSGQIGKALAQRDSNKEIQKQNQANLKAQKEWLDIHADNEVSKASYEGLKLQTDYYKEILPYRDKMSEQDIITSNNNLKEIAELKEKITYAREWQAIATAANDGKRIETEQQMDEVIKKQSEHRAEVLEILNKTTQALEEYDKYAKEDEGGYYDSEEIEKMMTDQIKEAISYRKELTNWLDDNKEAEKDQREEYEKESKLLDHIIGKLKNRKTLTKKELELVKKGINQDLEKTTDKVSAMKGAKQGKKDLETGTTITDEARLGEVTSDQKKLADSNKTAIEYEKTIRGISTVFSSITASIGVLKTIFNPDPNLSGWERIKSVFSVMVTQGMMLANNWQDVKQAGTDIAKWAAKRVAMMAAENAEKAKSVALGEVENAQQEKQVVLEAAETKENTAQAGLTLKETILNITKIIQQGVINALKAVEALLSGNITALGVATVAALVAGVVALGMWVKNLIEANSQETKLKEKVEETAEAAGKAKDAYKEISDTVSSYKDARSGIDSLTEGTIEFYDAVMKSNEAAQKLIDKLGLIAGTDYTIDTNGLIDIDENRLADKMFEEQQKVYQAQSRNSQARYNLARYNRDQAVEKFQQAVNTKDGLGVGFSREQAESILDRSHQKNELIEDRNGKKIGTSQMNLSQWEDIKSTFKQGLDNISNNELATTAAILNPINTITMAFAQEALVNGETKDGIIDITEEVGEFRAEYDKYTAEMLALERETSLANIRAYGSKENVEAFDKMNSTQRNILEDFTTKQRHANETEARSSWSSFWDTSDSGFFGKVGVGFLKGIINSVPGFGLANAIENTSQKGPNDRELKELYAKNVLGYTEQDGQWRDSAGNKVKDKEINKIDLDSAKDTYASGEYQAGEKANKLITKVGEIKSAVAGDFDQDSQDYIAEAFTAIMTGDQGYDFNTLTEKEMDAVAEQIQENHDYIMETYKAYNDKAQDDMRYTLGNFNVARFGAGEEKTDEERQKQERARETRDLKNYNEQMDSSAKALGTSSAALKIYDAALQTANKGTVKYTNSTAEAAAASYKFNKTYNEGRKAFKDNKQAWDTYVKALKKGKDISYDVADGAGAIIESLEGMGIELNTEDLKNPVTLKNINKLLSGTEKEAKAAYKALKEQSWMSDLTKNFGLSKTAAQDFIDSLNKAQEGKPFKISDSVLEEMNKSTKTLEDWKKWAEKYNLDIEVKTNVKQKATEFNPPTEDTITQHEVEDYKDGEGKVHKGYKWTERVRTAKPTLYSLGDLNFTKKSGGTSFKPSRGGGGGGKSGGSKSKPQKAEKFKPDTDIYHKVNTQITKVENSLKKLQRQEEKTLGTKLLKNLQTQWNQISTQVDNYKEKLKIAEKEQSKLQKKLAKNGVTFNEDGTVANYFKVLKDLENDIEKKRNTYNKKRKKSSEKTNQDRLKEIETLKEQYNTLKEEMNRADELASDFIPGIKEAWNESLDQQVELNIKAFDLEVNLSVDTKELQKTWNNFKQKIANNLRDDNILENAILTETNLSSNLRSGDNGLEGDLINQTQHVQEIMGQIALQEQNLENVYGNNKVAAYDALKEAIEKAQTSFEEVAEYQKELHDSYLNMLDQAKDKLDNQKEGYEQISKLLEHNKRLVELTYGEKAYETLKQYYNLQKNSNLAELKTLKQQQDYYKQNMLTAKQAMEDAEAALRSDALTADERERLNNKYLETIEKFEKTKDQWTEAVEASNAALEESIEFAQESLENTIKAAQQAATELLTNKKGGLDYAEEEWDLINRNADQYLDTINRLQGENNLESKYLDSIEKATNPNVQKKIKNAMDSELKALREKDKLTQYDLDRANKRYQIMLAQIALEEAQQNKTQMRLRRDSQGNYRYQYVADEDEIKKAQEELGNLYADLYNFDKERYKSTLSEIESVTREYNEKLLELSKIADPDEYAEKAALLQKEYSQLIEAIQKEGLVARNNVIESATDDLVFLGQETDDNVDAMMTGLIPAWESVNSLIQTTMKPLEYVDNLLTNGTQAWNRAREEIEAYENEMGTTADNIKSFTDKNLQQTEALIGDNKKLIESYTKQLSLLDQKIQYADQLIEKYIEEAHGIELLTAAYAMLEKQMLDNLDVYDQYSSNPDMVTSAREQSNSEDLPQNEGKSLSLVSPYILQGIFADSGKRVLSQLLVVHGFGTSEDSLETLVKNFQHEMGISETGVWDETTRKTAEQNGYSTGGYTGEWNSNEGRLAFLHQKELVLNAQDTENILNTVAIMRNLMASMNENILSRLAAASAGMVTNLGNGNTGLEQNVHIDATFPNVTNSNEIEEALRNLVNVASQRVTK